jgi:SAM-dependent methyltransferase
LISTPRSGIRRYPKLPFRNGSRGGSSADLAGAAAATFNVNDGQNMPVDAKEFWEAKLIDWERGRYGSPDRPLGFLEWIANRSSSSLRFRVAIVPELLKPFLSNKKVVELGCGSGIIARKFLDYGAASYLGVDIAESAIEKARSRCGSDGRIQFQVGGVLDLPPLSADLVVSLGLFDWLTDEEIATVFRQTGKADFLHAIAERRPGLQQWLHRSYVQLAYGYRTDRYRPRYLTCEHVRLLSAAGACRPLYVYRNWRLSFGALLSSLPIGPQV